MVQGRASSISEMMHARAPQQRSQRPGPAKLTDLRRQPTPVVTPFPVAPFLVLDDDDDAPFLVVDDIDKVKRAVSRLVRLHLAKRT